LIFVQPLLNENQQGKNDNCRITTLVRALRSACSPHWNETAGLSLQLRTKPCVFRPERTHEIRTPAQRALWEHPVHFDLTMPRARAKKGKTPHLTPSGFWCWKIFFFLVQTLGVFHFTENQENYFKQQNLRLKNFSKLQMLGFIPIWDSASLDFNRTVTSSLREWLGLGMLF